jgi:phosphate transport system permease protein
MIKGIPNIKPELFQWEYNTLNVLLMPALINTVIMTLISLLIAAPIGVFFLLSIWLKMQKKATSWLA